ncbi:MAG: C40 family peptidase [Deltaproteobacteria bacterium]|nr:C40 family peptidase [Deltaproteobacteria bacterium]MBW1953131.1 C40 family peptidase [Deltaproteobacteria bacterium]MBW1987009.1 C40 family peptidase [Deltaproteobacteria bacterium]MBW2134034.1 C40 family peptidase [Deltaproteobacteria bacterium]
MKIIPQRDGSFLLEPLSPKKVGEPTVNPRAKDQKKRRPGDDDYSMTHRKKTPIYPRWSFRELVLALAKKYQGAPYSLGASLKYSGATDCSGFVQYIYQGFRIDLPRTSREQAQVGKTVTQRLDFSRLLPGDLLFFRRGGGYIGHSGIYMGEGKMIHASNHRKGVTVTDLNQSYYINTFVVAKRVFEVRYPN